MTTIDGLTIEERGGPEVTCDGGTCYHGCSHVESAHAEEVRRLTARLDVAETALEEIIAESERWHDEGWTGAHVAFTALGGRTRAALAAAEKGGDRE